MIATHIRCRPSLQVLAVALLPLYTACMAGDPEAMATGELGGGTDTSNVNPKPSKPDFWSYNLPAELPSLACLQEFGYLGAKHPPLPPRVYLGSCERPSGTRELYAATTVGNSETGATSGLMIRAELNDNGALEVKTIRRFEECAAMEGIATSADCSLVSTTCRMMPDTAEEQTPDADADVRYDTRTVQVFDDKGSPLVPTLYQSQLWLYEWKDGTIKNSDPRPYRTIVSKTVRNTTHVTLRYGEADNTYGISTKSKANLHSDHALWVLDRNQDPYYNMTLSPPTGGKRGWGWNCGGVHAGFSRMAYQPASISSGDPKKPTFGPYYAAICTSDHEMRSVNFQITHPALMKTQGYNAWPSAKYRFHWPTEDYQDMDLGGAGAIVPVPGGGFLTLVVGVNESASGVDASGSRWLPTDIGLTRIDHRGRPLLVDTDKPAGMDPKTDADPTSDKHLRIRGVVKWLALDANAFVSHPQLAYLGQLQDGEHRFLLGWGVMRRRDEAPDEVERHKSMTVPWEYRVMEIDANGAEIQGTRRKIQGNGWGMRDEIVSHGRGQVAWVSTPDTTLRTSDEGMTPMCSPRELQFNVYTSAFF